MSFRRRITPHVDAELLQARELSRVGERAAAFAHLENAHVLGQSSTWLHVKVHAKMLIWAIGSRRAGELFGQLVRIIGAATKTFIGLVPTGNTGGANVRAWRSMPIRPELSALIEQAQQTR